MVDQQMRVQIRRAESALIRQGFSSEWETERDQEREREKGRASERERLVLGSAAYANANQFAWPHLAFPANYQRRVLSRLSDLFQMR